MILKVFKYFYSMRIEIFQYYFGLVQIRETNRLMKIQFYRNVFLKRDKKYYLSVQSRVIYSQTS